MNGMSAFIREQMYRYIKNIFIQILNYTIVVIQTRMKKLERERENRSERMKREKNH